MVIIIIIITSINNHNKYSKKLYSYKFINLLIFQIRLKNFESNNHLLKKKAISVKTVQFVIEDMSMFRKSKTLMKSYLF